MLAVATVLDVKDLDLRQASQALKRLGGSEVVEIQNAEHVHGLCAGLREGTFLLAGNTGDYLGVLNAGATIQVQGNAGQYLADNMTAGTIIVEGSAGYGAGLYPYGGTLVVHGDAGDFAATMNKGATILIGGDVGDEVGTYHLAGDTIVVGNAGRNFGNYIIRGNLYIGGKYVSLGHNTRLEDLTKEDLQKLRRLLEQYDVNADVSKFRKIVAQSTKPFYE